MTWASLQYSSRNPHSPSRRRARQGAVSSVGGGGGVRPCGAREYQRALGARLNPTSTHECREPASTPEYACVCTCCAASARAAGPTRARRSRSCDGKQTNKQTNKQRQRQRRWRNKQTNTQTNKHKHKDDGETNKQADAYDGNARANKQRKERPGKRRTKATASRTVRRPTHPCNRQRRPPILAQPTAADG